MASPTEMTPNQLARQIGTPDCPALIDLRIDADFDADPVFIPGARRHAAADIVDLVPALTVRRAVLYCHKGLKISQGAAAILRCEGVQAETLEGGMVSWRDAALPTVTAAALPVAQTSGGTLWVTRARPKIDRIACPWLIRRFVDPMARFLFVAPSQVDLVAERFGATAFDMPDGAWSHRGAFCTFDTMLAEFGLKVPALDRLAEIVRGADTDRHDLAPEAAGLLAVSLGLSRMYRDDLQQLEAGMGLYDALYRWARDAQDEGHDWPAAKG